MLLGAPFFWVKPGVVLQMATIALVLTILCCLMHIHGTALSDSQLRAPVSDSNLNASSPGPGILGANPAAAQPVLIPLLLEGADSLSVNATTSTIAEMASEQLLDARLRAPFRSPPTNVHYVDWAARTGLTPLRTCKAPSSAAPANAWIENTAAIEQLSLAPGPGPGRGVPVSIITEAAAVRMGISPTTRLPVTLLTIKHFDDTNIAHQLFYSGLPYALLELRHRFAAAHSTGSLMVLLHGSRGGHVRKTVRKNDGSVLSWLAGIVGLSDLIEAKADQEREAQPSANSGVLWSQTLASVLLPLLRLESLNLSHTGHAYVAVRDLVAVDVPTAALLFPFACFVDHLPPSQPMLSVRDALFTSSALAEAGAFNTTRYVLLVHRQPRYLVDSETLRLSSLVEGLQRLHLPVRVASFKDLPPLEQMRLVRGAAVLVAVHGAELTNMLFLPPRSSVVEISLRYGWCCDPVPVANRGYAAPPCTSMPIGEGEGKNPCRLYHKADFANMASALRLEYHLFDPIYADPPVARNPIERLAVHVNATELALLTRDTWLRCIRGPSDSPAVPLPFSL